MSSTKIQLLSIGELAKILQVSEGTIYYWVARNEIPFIRVGRHLRFKSSEVIGYFERITSGSKPACTPYRGSTDSKQPRRSLKNQDEVEAVLRKEE